jgi:hypothetical protein
VSHSLYSTLLVWYRQRGGVAKLHGKAISLQDPPPMSGAALEHIDYRPEIGERRIQRFDDRAREMNDAEVAEADAWLRGVLGG